MANKDRWSKDRRNSRDGRVSPKPNIANYEIDGVKIRIDMHEDAVRISRIDEDAGKITDAPDPALLQHVVEKIVTKLNDTPSIKFTPDIIPDDSGNYKLIPIAPEDAVAMDQGKRLKTYEIPEPAGKSVETPRALTFDDVKAVAHQLGEPLRAASQPAQIIDEGTGRPVRPATPSLRS